MNDDLPTEELPDDLRAQAGGRATPSVIGPYHLLHCLGEGGMGEVWEAELPPEDPERRATEEVCS